MRDVRPGAVAGIHHPAAAIIVVAIHRLDERAVAFPDADAPWKLGSLGHPQSAVRRNRDTPRIRHPPFVIRAELRPAGHADGPQPPALPIKHQHLMRAVVADIEVAIAVEGQMLRLLEPLADQHGRLALRRKGKTHDPLSADRQQMPAVGRHDHATWGIERHLGGLHAGTVVGHRRIGATKPEPGLGTGLVWLVANDEQLVLAGDGRDHDAVVNRQAAEALAGFAPIHPAARGPQTHRHRPHRAVIGADRRLLRDGLDLE